MCTALDTKSSGSVIQVLTYFNFTLCLTDELTHLWSIKSIAEFGAVRAGGRSHSNSPGASHSGRQNSSQSLSGGVQKCRFSSKGPGSICAVNGL